MKPKIEHVEIESLIPYARNSRTHSDAQTAQIAASIKEFGFTNPVLIDQEGGIIAGHGRVMAARKLKLSEVPCIRLGHLTDTQKRAYVIADNKLALNAGWDNEMLKVEFLDLGELNYNLELTGFDLQEIASILDYQDYIEEPEGVGYKEVFNIIVECSSEEEQEKIFNRLDTEGYKCRVQSL
jgi:ParB-like chromosome segregation protein Spo0J